MCAFFDVNRFYPKTQLSWLARLGHSHCNSADPLTDGLEVCCVFYRPGPGGAMCVVWWWKVLKFAMTTEDGDSIIRGHQKESKHRVHGTDFRGARKP